MSEQTGAKIKEARTAAGMTQKELAEAIDGLSASDISKAERGLIGLTDEQLEAIAKATGAESLNEVSEEAPVVPAASEEATPSEAADNNPMASVMGMVGNVMRDDAKREKAANTVMGMVGNAMRDDASREKTANAVMGMVGEVMGDDASREKAANTVMGVVNDVIGSEEAGGEA